MDSVKSIRLNNGLSMPIVGLGTSRCTEEAFDEIINSAIDAGYRHIDTAFIYFNESFIGNTLKKVFAAGKIKRQDLFITSKLPPNGMQPDAVEYFLSKTLSNLQIEYLDLYLIHCPISAKRQENDKDFLGKDGEFDPDCTVDLVKTWKEMEKLVRRGLIKSIGLSNFNSQQIQRIYDAATIKPTVLQVECHAFFPQFELHEFCKSLNIAMTAYSPLGAPYKSDFKSENQNVVPLMEDPRLKPLCEKYTKSPAQILLRYLVQRKIIVIPKSNNPQRIKENINIFDFQLSEEDMNVLKSIASNKRFFTFDNLKKLADHPEYPFSIPF